MPLYRYEQEFVEIEPRVFKSEGGVVIRLGKQNQTIEMIDGGNLEKEFVEKVRNRITIHNQLYH